MKKFNTLLNEVYARILEQNVVPPAIPQDGGPVVPTGQGEEPPPEAQPAPEPEAQPAPEPKPLTPEGKVFLIGYIRKALAINPDSLSPDEKAVFNEPEINAQNGEEILKQLQDIISSHQ